MATGAPPTVKPPDDNAAHKEFSWGGVWDDIKGAAPAIGSAVGATYGAAVGAGAAAYDAVAGEVVGSAVQGAPTPVAAPAPVPVAAQAAPPTTAAPEVVTAEKNQDEETSHGSAANILAGGLYQSPPQLARNILLGN